MPHASGNSDGTAWLRAMRQGDFAAAFAASDAVLRGRDASEADDPRLPYHERWVWDGRPLAGRRVLVRCYHGLGDTLQFARFLPALGRAAAAVTLEVQPALLPLLHDLVGPARLHPFDPAAPLPPGECDLEIMELAHALRRPPDPAPYLRMVPRPGPPGRVGFCWCGGGWDGARDLPFALLSDFLAIPGLRPISLQRGPAAAMAGLADPLRGSMDVPELAGLIAGLDAVVTVDTMVAHLAGALGRPVFLLLKREPDWRWLHPGAWYGSVRQYEQSRPGEWAEPVARLGHDLRTMLAGNSPTDPSFVAA